MIERIESGARSSKIVKHNGVAYITGQVAEGDTIQEQVQTCLDKIDALLIKAGSSRENMLRVTIWLADMSDFAGLNEVWNAWVPEGHAPARACGEAKLARAELKVELSSTQLTTKEFRRTACVDPRGFAPDPRVFRIKRGDTLAT
jgi:enamine deaminase RidA (YjgF/YER057c/UK114 family)